MNLMSMLKSGKSAVLAGALLLTASRPLNDGDECEYHPQGDPLVFYLSEQDFGALIKPSQKSFFISGKYFQKSALTDRVEFYKPNGEKIIPFFSEIWLNFGENGRELFILKRNGSLDLYKRRG